MRWCLKIDKYEVFEQVYSRDVRNGSERLYKSVAYQVFSFEIIHSSELALLKILQWGQLALSQNCARHRIFSIVWKRRKKSWNQDDISVNKRVASNQQLKKFAHFVSQFYKPSLLLAWSLTSGCLVSYHVLLHPLSPSGDQGGAARGSGFYIYVI